MVPKIRAYNNSEILTGECSVCGIKPIEDFPISSIVEDKIYYRNKCKICFLSHRKQYRLQNKHQSIFYRENNKSKISQYNKEYFAKNKDKLKLLNHRNSKKYKESGKLLEYSRNYASKNREKVNASARIYSKKMRLTNINYKLNQNISRSIRSYIKNFGGSKNRISYRKYLPYTLDELKQHLEKQFEPWMNWDNQGKYNSKIWNDNNQLTWAWQIDHIIPQSKLPYISMEDENFKKCWSLENLRPYSAKQNIIDGNRRE